jgi:hypothetical protein
MELEEREELRRDISDVIDRDQAAVLKSAVGELDLEDGVSVITLKPTVFQNVRTVEQVECARKESITELMLKHKQIRDFEDQLSDLRV